MNTDSELDLIANMLDEFDSDDWAPGGKTLQKLDDLAERNIHNDTGVALRYAAEIANRQYLLFSILQRIARILRERS